jgi:hypothetical protein
MDVGLLFEGDHLSELVEGGAVYSLSGWLVIIGNELFILEESYAEPYEVSKKVRILNSDIVYAVRDRIYPLGGGKSFVFHRVKAIGRFVSVEDSTIDIESLCVYEKPAGFISIDIDSKNIELCKRKYGAYILNGGNSSSGDWLDLV